MGCVYNCTSKSSWQLVNKEYAYSLVWNILELTFLTYLPIETWNNDCGKNSRRRVG